MASAPNADFSKLTGRIARKLLGEPNKTLSRNGTLRWGNHGSFKVDVEEGVWHDKESKEGGGALALIMREKRCDMAGALRWLEERV